MLRGLKLTGHFVSGLLYLESFLEDLLTSKPLFIEEIRTLIEVRGRKRVGIKLTQICSSLETAGKEVIKLFLYYREVFHDFILIIIDPTHYCSVGYINILDLSG